MGLFQRVWLGVWGCCAFGMMASTPEPVTHLSQAVYVWQRAWTEEVRTAVRERGGRFSMVVALSAEVVWRDGQPELVRVPVDWASMASTGTPIGVALRIGPFAGPFGPEDERTRWLAALARSLAKEAADHDCRLGELQIDFDCAESKLAGYAAWTAAIRREVSPTKVMLTALPAWLKHEEFRDLARSADGYVLQVHSLDRPRQPDAPFTLCDLGQARKAVERAAQIGVPFRVALPTYGYLIGFDAQGRFSGLSAEGPAKRWPSGTQLQEVRSDPEAMAELVRGWTGNRPGLFQGIIWYRLPVQGDTLNWSWPTLARVMRGEVPQAKARAEIRRPENRLFEFDLINEGDADFAGDPEVLVRWTGADPVASDGLRGFQPQSEGSNRVRYQHRGPPLRLRPFERQMIGWLRLAGDGSVEVELRGTHPAVIPTRKSVDTKHPDP